MTGLPPLADTHCHLCLDAFTDDLDAVLDRAREAGVRRILVPGIDVPTSERAVALAETHDEIYAAVGVHPHDASSYGPQSRAQLRRLASSPRVIAIGEIGLDYYRDRSPREAQQSAFADQLDLAAEVGLPVVVHNREATGDVLERLLPWAAERPRPGVLHAFSGDEVAAAAASEAGFYLGVAGPITFPNAGDRRILTAKLARQHVVLETDSPYLTPHPRRGERNEPARLGVIAEALMEVWGGRPEEIRRILWDNAVALFHWNHEADYDHLL